MDGKAWEMAARGAKPATAAGPRTRPQRAPVPHPPAPGPAPPQATRLLRSLIGFGRSQSAPIRQLRATLCNALPQGKGLVGKGLGPLSVPRPPGMGRVGDF